MAHVSYWENPRHLLTWVTEWGTDGRNKGEAKTALATKGLDVSLNKGGKASDLQLNILNCFISGFKFYFYI